MYAYDCLGVYVPGGLFETQRLLEVLRYVHVQY